MTAWPDPVERVAEYLRAAGAESRIEQFGADTATAADAARVVGSEAHEIVKSLVVMCDARPVLALVPGDRRGDLHRIARAVSASTARVATANEVRAVTGFEPGAVAPFPQPRIVRTVIDRSLLARRALWIGAGSPRHLARLPTPELVRLTRAETADLVTDI